MGQFLSVSKDIQSHRIFLPEEMQENLNAGDHIRIVFDGIIKESYPLQLGNVFAIYLLDENGNL